MEGLPGQSRRSLQADDARRRRVYSPLPDPCPARRLSPHPSLRPFRQCQPGEQYCIGPPPPSRAKPQIPQRDTILPTAPRPTKITLAPLTRPVSPPESEQAPHSLAPNPHRLTPPPAQKTPRFPPSRLFGRLPPCTPSRLRQAGIRKPLTIPDLPDVAPEQERFDLYAVPPARHPLLVASPRPGHCAGSDCGFGRSHAARKR